jgi:hypothetical protein
MRTGVGSIDPYSKRTPIGRRFINDETTQDQFYVNKIGCDRFRRFVVRSRTRRLIWAFVAASLRTATFSSRRCASADLNGLHGDVNTPLLLRPSPG